MTFSVLAGCTLDAAPTEQLGEVHQKTDTGDGSGLYDEEHNGRSVVGAEFQKPKYMPNGATEYFSVSTRSAVAAAAVGPDTVSVVGGASLKTSSGKSVLGLVLNGPTTFEHPVNLRIRTAHVDGTITPLVTHYGLDVQVDGGDFSPACEDAIPLAGVILTSGEHVAAPARITFSCNDGAASECTMFGYPAGPVIPRSPMWGVHDACMEMVRASYCGNGSSSTRTGTRIAFYDAAGVYTPDPALRLPIMKVENWPPDTTHYYFEAAFKRGHGPALCSARARWPVLTDSCIAAIPDCPDDTIGHMTDAAGGVLYVASMFNQLRLAQWRYGNDRVSTVQGYYNPDEAVQPPALGEHVYEHVSAEGVLLRIPPDSLDPGAITSVSLFMGLNALGEIDTLVARTDDPRFTARPYVNLREEGRVYLHSDGVPDPQALRMYRNRITGDYLSTTNDPGDANYLAANDPRTGDNLIGFIAGLPGAP